MTIIEMLQESAALAALGISIVFSFLILLVICITLVGKVIRALDFGKKIQDKGTADADTIVKKGENDSIIAAITAAVNEYRKPQ